MRQPKQVLVLPYKHIDNVVLFAIFKREDLNVWQGVAGGVEEGETVLDACKRESKEEANIPECSKFIKLDSKSTIPVVNISKDFIWGDTVFNVEEYCYGVSVDGVDIKLSDEHKEFRWVSYEDAYRLFKWDSNRNALWELNARIQTNNYKGE